MRLVTYSWLAVVIAIACAAIGWLGLAGWLAVVVVVASVAMHVAGNAIGTRLREATDRQLAERHPGLRRPAAVLPVAAPTPLGRRASLGTLVPVSAGIGAACGGGLGAAALVWLTNCSVAGAVLGGSSSAVLGGLFGFLLASFVEIVRTSLQASLAAERLAPPAAGGSAPAHRHA